MHLPGSKYGPAIAAIATAVLIVAMDAARELGGSERLVWLPVGLAVVALHITPQLRWPGMIAALFAGHFAGRLLSGVDWIAALGIANANVVEAVVCALFGVRLLEHRARATSPFSHLGALFLAAGAAATVGMLLALPFCAVHGASYLLSWLMAHLLGILTAAPIVLFLHQRSQDAQPQPQPRSLMALPCLPLAVIGTFVVALATLWLFPAALLFLLVVPLALAVIRCGAVAAAAGVFSYAAAARIASIGTGVPPALADHSPEAATLILQLALLLMLAAALAFSALLRTYESLQSRLQQRNAELSESLKTLTMAESLAGIGRWRLELRSGRQHWSPAMLEMNGLDPRDGPDPGDVLALLPDGGAALFAALAEHRDSRGPYTIDYTISPRNGAEQFLRMVVSNEFDEHGKRVAVFGVAMDVTMQVHREQALKVSRQHALDLAAQAQKLALTDPLTGLANRRSVFEQLARLAQTSPQQGEPLTVVLFDIDHFKRVNDTYGHQTGDAVLQRVAELARRQIRRSDLVGRIGGEEFVWLLPGIDAGRARDLAERLREVIEHESARGGLPQVTISLGMALLRMGDTPEQLIARADEALYHAKNSGRNCVRRAA